MMYTFKCKAAGNVTMTQADSEQLLQIIGKTPAAEGIIEVGAVNAAIQALDNAVEKEESGRRHQAAKQDVAQSRDTPAEDQVVELHQRIWPLVEMLKRARDEREVIVWGV